MAPSLRTTLLAAAVALVVAAPAAHAVSYPYETSTNDGSSIVTGGTKLSFANEDDGTATVVLPFDFRLFSGSWTAGHTLTISTNGTIQFSDSSTTYTNGVLPSSQFTGAVLMPYWDDFDVSQDATNEGVWAGVHGTAPSRSFTVHWQGHEHGGAMRRLQFEATLYEGTNRVDFAYWRSLTDPMADGSAATIGMQGPGGTSAEFVQFSVNAASIPSSSFSIAHWPELPANTSWPIVKGSTVVGQTLTTTTGTWSGNPHAYTIRWGRCTAVDCGTGATIIPGATSTSYVVTSADVGKYLVALVEAENGWGRSTDDAWSFPLGPVTAPVPVNTAPPVLYGTPLIGSMLTVSNGDWTGSPTAYAFQWYRCMPISGGGCTPSAIPGATGGAYVPGTADLTGRLYVNVRAQNAFGWSDWVTSNAVGPVQEPVVPVPVNTTAPSVSGGATVGDTVTLDRGTWSGSPDAYEQQWLRCVPVSGGCMPEDIAGATGMTYVLDAADVGSVVYARVRAHNAGGWSAWKTSTVVGPVRRPDVIPPPGSTATTPVPPPAPEAPPPSTPAPNASRSTVEPLTVRVLRMAPTRFRAARSGGSITKRGGARVTLRVSRIARLTFRVERRSGRRWVSVRGSFGWTATSLQPTLRFSGRVAGKALRPASYRLVVTASSGSTRSAAARVAFRIVR